MEFLDECSRTKMAIARYQLGVVGYLRVWQDHELSDTHKPHTCIVSMSSVMNTNKLTKRSCMTCSTHCTTHYFRKRTVGLEVALEVVESVDATAKAVVAHECAGTEALTQAEMHYSWWEMACVSLVVPSQAPHNIPCRPTIAQDHRDQIATVPSHLEHTRDAGDCPPHRPASEPWLRENELSFPNALCCQRALQSQLVVLLRIPVSAAQWRRTVGLTDHEPDWTHHPEQF